MENVMKNLLLAAAAATMVFAVSPAFASAASDAEDGYTVYPSPGECHFVTQRIVTQNGRVTYERHQVCN
jgi:hypothetical protein